MALELRWKALKTIVAVATISGLLLGPVPRGARAEDGDERRGVRTPIEHVVVIFQENVSFDHYFATYPHAENLPGESVFKAAAHTPKVDNLVTANLLSPHNANSVQPFRLSRAQADTCDQSHEYKEEQEAFDDCSTRETVAMSGHNVGDLLNARGVTWGFFQGGFKPTTPFNPPAAPKALCAASHIGANGKAKGDYIPHHQPFQYYASTANPHHLPPSSVAMIGKTDQANHQYDLSDFWDAVEAGHMPAVSYVKAAGFQDGHADYSSPLFEQQFLVETLNRLQAHPEWKTMAVIIAYDDSDGWYDHVVSPLVNPSSTPEDAAFCSGGSPRLGPYLGRCGYGPRLPLLVISPFAKRNFVAHNVTDQSSILRFI